MKQNTAEFSSSFIKIKTNPNIQYGFRGSIQWKGKSNEEELFPLWLNNVSFSKNLPGWYYEHANSVASCLEVVLEGTLTVTHNNKITLVPAGYAYFLPGGEYNKLSNHDTAILRKLTFTFSGQYAYFILYSVIGENYLIPLKSINRVQNYYHTLKKLLEQANRDNIPHICGLSLEFIMDITQMIQKTSMPAPLNSVLRILHANLDTRIKIADLATSVDLSPYQLNKMFREYFGQTLSQYLIHYRMEKAKAFLMNNRQFALKNIAMQLGYANPFIFSAAFRKYYGISPKDFRNKFHSAS